MSNPKRFALGAVALLFTLGAAAQKPVIYPAKGQSAQQQQKDDGECHDLEYG